jgi:aspartyl protease family protein
MTISLPDPATHVPLYLLVAAILLVLALAGRVPILRALFSLATLLAIGALLVVTIDQQAGLDPRLARLASLLRGRGQDVVGRETRVPMAIDGHFWVDASVNGVRRRMLVDTGATATTLSERTAAEAGLVPRAGLLPIVLQTANGAVAARTATVRELRVGNIVARDVDVVIVPHLGGVDIVGMNFLSRLKGWRVDDGTLVLTPHHPQHGEPPQSPGR